VLKMPVNVYFIPFTEAEKIMKKYEHDVEELEMVHIGGNKYAVLIVDADQNESPDVEDNIYFEPELLEELIDTAEDYIHIDCE
jgi:hypothetical protein